MGDRSAVGGMITFEAFEKDPEKAALRAARAELARRVSELGGKVEFYTSDSDVDADFIADLKRSDEFAPLRQFFNITEGGLIECGQLGDDGGLEVAAAKLVELAGAYDLFARGNITVYGEEPGDIWRLLIENNEIERQTPKLVWPNGDTE